MNFWRSLIAFLAIALIFIGLTTISYPSLINISNARSYILLGTAFILITTLIITDKTQSKKLKYKYLSTVLFITSIFYIIVSIVNYLENPDPLIIPKKTIPPTIGILFSIFTFLKSKK